MITIPKEVLKKKKKKTLCNIVEALFIIFFTLMSVLYFNVQMDQ